MYVCVVAVAIDFYRRLLSRSNRLSILGFGYKQNKPENPPYPFLKSNKGDYQKVIHLQNFCFIHSEGLHDTNKNEVSRPVRENIECVLNYKKCIYEYLSQKVKNSLVINTNRIIIVNLRLTKRFRSSYFSTSIYVLVWFSILTESSIGNEENDFVYIVIVLKEECSAIR